MVGQVRSWGVQARMVTHMTSKPPMTRTRASRSRKLRMWHTSSQLRRLDFGCDFGCGCESGARTLLLPKPPPHLLLPSPLLGERGCAVMAPRGGEAGRGGSAADPYRRSAPCDEPPGVPQLLLLGPPQMRRMPDLRTSNENDLERYCCYPCQFGEDAADVPSRH